MNALSMQAKARHLNAKAETRSVEWRKMAIKVIATRIYRCLVDLEMYVSLPQARHALASRMFGREITSYIQLTEGELLVMYDWITKNPEELREELCKIWDSFTEQQP